MRSMLLTLARDSGISSLLAEVKTGSNVVSPFGPRAFLVLRPQRKWAPASLRSAGRRPVGPPQPQGGGRTPSAPPPWVALDLSR